MMKFNMLLTIVLFESCLFAQFSADGPKELVIGSPHDLRRFAKRNSDGISVCEYCHPKPPGNISESTLPWNQQSKLRRYSFYASPTFNATEIQVPAIASGGMASAATLMCLSCHDGATSDAAMDRNLRAGGAGPTNAGLQSVLNLAGDHPVQFTYGYELASTHRGLQSPVEGVGVSLPYVGRGAPLPLYKESPTDVSGRMECATCHDPHNGKEKHFLRMNNSGSALCLNCH
jgi:predicted CXXCH cytochrome family protein